VARLFLSYATADKRLAHTVFGWLTGWGHDVFFDRDTDRGISIGEDWKQRLYRELGRVDAVVCVVTADYLRSMWCTAEVAIADSRGCRLLPLRFEPELTHKLMERVQYGAFHADRGMAREQLRVTLRQLDAGGRTGWREGQNPYPGLKPFQSNRSRLFFGRGQETRDLAARLRAEAGRGVLVIFGPSGCGKSSLLRAGLLPLLRDDPDWLVLDPWQPRGDPLRQLAARLSKARQANAGQAGADDPVRPGWSPSELRDRLGDRGGLPEIAEELLEELPGTAGRLLISIDQAEQLFTSAVDAEHVAALGAAVAGAVSGPVRIVATLRSEFLDDLSALPYLSDLAATAIETRLLGPLSRDMLRLAIEEPAKIAGLRLAPELVARLLADTGGGEALPLLASALEELAEGRGPGDRITIADYDDLGARHGYHDLAGVHAVLARRADRTLEAAAAAGALPAPEVLAGLVRLVTLDEAGRRSRRRVDRRTLASTLRAAFAVFVDNRLLTSDGEWVEVAHEALLTAWPPLDRAITEHGDALRAARSVEQAAAEWFTAGRTDGYLWDDERHTATALALGLPDGDGDGEPPVALPVELDPRAREFLAATRARILTRRQLQRRRTARTVTVLSVFLALALVASGIAGLQWLSARSQRDAATVRGLLARADEVRATDPQLALRLGLAADALGAHGQAEASAANLLNTLTQNSYAATLTGHTSSVFAAAFSPDGRLLATGDGDDHTVLLWDVTDPKRPQRLGRPLTDHSDWVLAAAFSPDGHTLATTSGPELILWDVTDPRQPRQRARRSADGPASGTDSLGLVFTPDGRTLATTGQNALTLWDVTDPDNPSPRGGPLVEDIGRLSDLAVDRDGRLLAAAVNGTLALWNIADPERPVPLYTETDSEDASSVAFDPSGHVLALGGEDGSVTLSRVDDPSHPVPIGQPFDDGINGEVRKIRFHPARPLLTITGENVELWDIGDPTVPRRTEELTDHTNSVYGVAFSPTGHAMATASADNTVILWGASDPVQPTALGRPLSGHTKEISALAFGAGGQTLVSGSEEPTGMLWDLAGPAEPSDPVAPSAPSGPVGPSGQPLTGHDEGVTAVATQPGGHVVATGGEDGTVILWDARDPRWPRRLGSSLTGQTGDIVTLAFNADGSRLVTADSNVTVTWWNVADPERPRRVAGALAGRSDYQPAVMLSPDWRTLASGHDMSKRVVLRDVSDPTNARLLGGELPDRAEALAFSPDGHTLAIGNWTPDVALWDITDPERPRQIGQPLLAPDGGLALAFSPDGRTLAIGGGLGTELWSVGDPERPHQLGTIFDSGRSVTALAFSPDGRTLATGDTHGGVQRWSLSQLVDLREHLTERACERARRGLTAEEWARLVGPAKSYRATCP
jgi:WD40 repeat protein